MPTVSQFASTSSVVRAASFASLADMHGASNSVYASLTALDANVRFQVGGFNLDAVLPATAAPNTVTVTIRGYLINPSGATPVHGIVNVRNGDPARFFYNGSQIYLTNVATAYSTTLTPGDAPAWTRAELSSLLIDIEVMCYDLNTVVYIDSVQVEVLYNAFTGGGSTSTSIAHLRSRDADPYPARYQVEVRSGGLPQRFDLKTVLDEFSSLSYTKRHNAAGDWTLSLPTGAPGAAEISARKSVIRVLRNGVEDFAGLNLHRAATFKRPAESAWTLSGTDLSGVFRRRIVTTGTNDTDAYTDQPGPAIAYFINTNYIAPLNAERGNYQTFFTPNPPPPTNIADVRMGYITNGGDTVWVSGSNQTLHDMIQEIASGGNVVLKTRTDLNTGHVVVDVVTGVDRRFDRSAGTGVLLSLDSESCRSLSYTDDGLGVINDLYIGGTGRGSARTVREVTDANSIDAWGRQEGFYDFPLAGSNASYLDSAAKTRLAQRAQSQSISVEVDDTEQLGYGARWDVGDIVTVRLPEIDVLVDLVVSEVTVTLAGNAPAVLTITLGAIPMSLVQRLKEFQRDIFAATQAPPEDYAFTRLVSGAGKVSVTDSDLSPAKVRAGTVAIIEDTTTGDIRWAVRNNVGWTITAVFAKQALAVEVAGPGKTTISDADFTTPPPVGQMAVVRDSTRNSFRFAQKTSVGWVTGAVANETQPAVLLSGAGKKSASDADFTAAEIPPVGSTVTVKDTTSGSTYISQRAAVGSWVTTPAVGALMQGAQLAGAGKTTVSDADFNGSGYTPAIGSTVTVQNTTDSSVRMAQKTAATGGWVVSPPLNALLGATQVEGPGKTTPVAADYTKGEPPTGGVGVVKDTASGAVRITARDGASYVSSPPLHPQVPITTVLSGAGKTNAADTDFSSTPPNGSTAFVVNTTDATKYVAIKIDNVWTSKAW